MKVELLYFDGCPNYQPLVAQIVELLAERGIEDEVQLRRVESSEDAERERFLGSPTVRVDGFDVEAGAEERTDFGLKCRIYPTPEGLSGMPPRPWIEAAIGPAGAASPRE
ncbi:MAG: DUF2703 domain-containing protein [Solirubrobacterales bacterium]